MTSFNSIFNYVWPTFLLRLCDNFEISVNSIFSIIHDFQMGLYRKEKSFWSEQARPSLVEQGSRNRGRGGFWQIRQSYLSQRGRLFSPLYYLPPTPTDFQTFLRRCRAPTNQAYHAIAVLTIFVPSKDGLLVPGDSWLLPFFKQWNQSLFRVVCEFNILKLLTVVCKKL